MNINFRVTGKERKALVEALSEITFSEAAYAGAPTFAYRVGDYTVDKNGVIFYPPALAPEAVALVVEKLKERGFTPEGEAQADLPEDDAPADGGYGGHRGRGKARYGGRGRSGSRPTR